MRFYVNCKDSQEKIYITFQKEPQTRSDIPAIFSLKCQNGQIEGFTNNDVSAEVGMEPIAGAVLGGVLFLIDPLIGLFGALIGAISMNTKEENKVKKFNNSIV